MCQFFVWRYVNFERVIYKTTYLNYVKILRIEYSANQGKEREFPLLWSNSIKKYIRRKKLNKNNSLTRQQLTKDENKPKIKISDSD